MGVHAIDHGSTRGGRWVRERRIRFALWLAAAEGLLYLFHALHWWAAVALAAIAVLFWWYVARPSRSDLVRQLGWVFATSQLLVLCVPLAIALLTTIAVVVIALLAIGGLIFLFTQRS